jgi:hypothetical protein
MDIVNGLATQPWRKLTPQEGSNLLQALPATWWVAGGWALDLFLGKVTREHKDLDIGIFRKDATSVLEALPDWEFFEAKDGELTQLVQGYAPRPDVNSLWCKRTDSSQWEFELMLDELDRDFWVFRRDRQIKRLLTIAIRRASDGIAYLAPEIQLLYKMRATRAHDQTDFDLVVPHLQSDARTWLRESLSGMNSEHPWISVLA